MSFQYTYDANGKPVGVFIPINEWEEISNELRKIKKSKKTSNSNSTILSGIKKGMRQVSQIEKKKIKSISLQQMLNEL